MWGRSSPNQWFESYCVSHSDDPAIQKFEHTFLISDIVMRLNRMTFSIPALNARWGEPCRFLAALTEITRPTTIVDIGTSNGGSSRAFLDYSPFWSKVFTFDIMPWNSYPESWLNEKDFAGKLTQHVDDLGDENKFTKHAELLASADLIYCDGPKDGVFEYKFIDMLSKLEMKSKTRYLVLDDIRFLNMAALWRDIDSPKFDATSIGHWSGTGLVDITNGLKLK